MNSLNTPNLLDSLKNNCYYNSETKKNIIMNNFQIITPLDYALNIVKYDELEEIKYYFPLFIYTDKNKNEKIMFNLIYKIKLENPFLFVDNLYKSRCDNILICCDTRIKCKFIKFNILFQLEGEIPYFVNLKSSYIYPQALIKYVYNNNTDYKN